MEFSVSGGDQVWLLDIDGSSRYKAEWKLSEVFAGCFGISSVRVIDSEGIDAPLTLSASNSVWEGVKQVFGPGEEYSGATDSFVGFAHNTSSQTPISQQVIVDGAASAGGTGERGYNQQSFDFVTPGTQTPGGQYETHHIFQGSALTVHSRWVFNSGVQQKTAYAAMLPVATQSSGGLRTVEVQGKPARDAAHDGSYLYAADNHQPSWVSARNDAHRFELLMELPIGAGRLLSPPVPTWEFANGEKAFLHDALLSASPAGTLKAYVAWASGPMQPALSCEHIATYTVRAI